MAELATLQGRWVRASDSQSQVLSSVPAREQSVRDLPQPVCWHSEHRVVAEPQALVFLRTSLAVDRTVSVYQLVEPELEAMIRWRGWVVPGEVVAGWQAWGWG